MNLTTWRKELTRAFKQNGDSWDDVERITWGEAEDPLFNLEEGIECKGDEWLDYEFNSGLGGEESAPFWLWTQSYVYFEGSYDGSQWVAWVPRHPCEGKPESV